MSDEWRRFGDEIRAARTELGLSYRKAADLAGIAHATWQRIERGGECQPATIAKISKAMGWPKGTAEAILFGGAGLEERLDRIENQLDLIEKAVLDAFRFIASEASPALRELAEAARVPRPARRR